MAPTLPYELVSSIIVEVIGNDVYRQLVDYDYQLLRERRVKWGTWANLASVSAMFLEITRRLGSIVYGPYSTPTESIQSLCHRSMLPVIVLKQRTTPLFTLDHEIHHLSTLTLSMAEMHSPLMTAYANFFLARKRRASSRGVPVQPPFGTFMPGCNLFESFQRCRGIEPRGLSLPLLDAVVTEMQTERILYILGSLGQSVYNSVMEWDRKSNSPDISDDTVFSLRTEVKSILLRLEFCEKEAEEYLISLGILYPRPQLTFEILKDPIADVEGSMMMILTLRSPLAFNTDKEMLCILQRIADKFDRAGAKDLCNFVRVLARDGSS